jgi:hypothetical protein
MLSQRSLQLLSRSRASRGALLGLSPVTRALLGLSPVTRALLGLSPVTRALVGTR